MDAERERQRSSLEAPATPPVAHSPRPRAAPITKPARDRLQRAMDRVEARTSRPGSTTHRGTTHRSSIDKPAAAGPSAAMLMPVAQAAEPKLAAAAAATLQQRPLQQLQAGMETFLLAAIVGWLLYSIVHGVM